MEAGKGASPRPVDRDRYGENYDRIFGDKKKLSVDRDNSKGCSSSK